MSEITPEKKPDNKNTGTLGRPLSAVFVTVLIYLSIQITVLIVSLILIAAHHNSGYSVNDSAPAEFAAIVIAESLTVYLVLKILRHRRLTLSFIGLGRKPAVADLWKGTLAFGAFFLVFFGIALVIYSFSPDITNQKQDVGFKELKSHTDNVLAFVSLVILPPLGEEVLFRGYLYSALRKYWRFIPSLLVTSLLFGSAHLLTGDTGLLWIAGIETFILSVVLVYLRQKTGALYAGMLVHMLNNLLAFFVIIK